MVDQSKLMRDMERVVQSKGVRSADRAYMQTMIRQLQKGTPLTYQERVNAWAFLNRYAAYLGD